MCKSENEETSETTASGACPPPLDVADLPRAWNEAAILSVVIGVFPLYVALLHGFHVDYVTIPWCILLGLVSGIIGVCQHQSFHARNLLLSILGIIFSICWTVWSVIDLLIMISAD